MAEKEITRINVSDFGVSIVGLKAVIEKIAETYSDKTDDDIRDVMMQELEKDNYIPGSARESYGKASVREFRKIFRSALYR